MKSLFSKEINVYESPRFPKYLELNMFNLNLTSEELNEYFDSLKLVELDIRDERGNMFQGTWVIKSVNLLEKNMCVVSSGNIQYLEFNFKGARIFLAPLFLFNDPKSGEGA